MHKLIQPVDIIKVTAELDSVTNYTSRVVSLTIVWCVCVLYVCAHANANGRAHLLGLRRCVPIKVGIRSREGRERRMVALVERALVSSHRTLLGWWREMWW